MNTNSDFTADDYPLKNIPDTPLWSENYAFACHDAAQGIGMMVMLGRWWGDPTLWREVISVALPGGRLLCIKNYGRAATEKIASASMFKVDVLRSQQSYRVSYDGPAWEQSRDDLIRFGFLANSAKRCRIDLVFDSDLPVWDMSGHGKSASDIAGSLHIEQVGSGNGFIEFGGERFDVKNAFMSRDHSRGVRILDKYKRHTWTQGYFDAEDITFNVYAMEVYGVEGLAMASASITQGKRRLPAAVKDIQLINGHMDAWKPYQLTLSSELGDMPLKISKTVTSAPYSVLQLYDISHGRTLVAPAMGVYEEAVFWDWQGKPGVGWSERVFAPEKFPDPE